MLSQPNLTLTLFEGEGGRTDIANYDVFGTSVRRSSRSAFGRSTGNDVSGHYKRHYFLFFSFFSFFFFFFFFFFFLLRRLLFS